MMEPMILKIKLNKQIPTTLDAIEHRKLCKYRYSISDVREYLDIWMNTDDDELETFCSEISKFYHIDSFDVYYGKFRWEFRNKRIVRRKLW